MTLDNGSSSARTTGSRISAIEESSPYRSRKSDSFLRWLKYRNMYQLRVGVIQIAVFLAITIATLEMSSANRQCKQEIMDIYINKCRFGRRNRRAVEKFDLNKLMYKLGELDKIDVKQPSEPESRKQQHKREVTGSSVESIPSEQSVVGKKHDESPNPDTLRTIVQVDDFAILSKGNFGDGDESDLIKQYLERFKSHLSTNKREPSSSSFRSWVGSADFLGFDLSAEEAEELYNELSERIPRNPQDEQWNMFLQAAARCCADIAMCRANPTMIPCLNY